MIREAQDPFSPSSACLPGPLTHTSKPCSPGKRPLFNLARGSGREPALALPLFPSRQGRGMGRHPGRVVELKGWRSGKGQERGILRKRRGRARQATGANPLAGLN